MLAELFEWLLEVFNPKTTPGKVIWTLIVMVGLTIGILELIAALG